MLLCSVLLYYAGITHLPTGHRLSCARYCLLEWKARERRATDTSLLENEKLNERAPDGDDDERISEQFDRLISD